ncbi:hypothetical protein MUU72_18100 [Streptomyces sp. RS10V-4]|uniref:hypothetical protein n=1 Tax=Streptomyces rhizoryzae TaxID=2932493 RepID=UPI00200641BD|nr:hypothetical protein [Streptomyces rhizoryzae]MCK7624997.1 hypothetical protein [Streptomyces rhizoryzae]
MTCYPHLPSAGAATCDLCHDRRPAAGAPVLTVRPPLGPQRQVRLCTPCSEDRPGRRRRELIEEDFSWQVMARQAHDLADAYAAGRWLPYEDEHRWALGLARTYWTRPALEAALRDPNPYLRAGRLVRVVEPLPRILGVVGAGDRALRPAQALLDTLAVRSAR